MDIVLYGRGAPWAEPIEQAFLAGLGRHGLTAERRRPVDRRICDLAVTWSARPHRVFAAQRAAGRHWLILERGYVGDRRFWTSLSLDGLHGRSAGLAPRDDGARFAAHFADLTRPWRPPGAGAYMLLLGQLPGDEQTIGIDLEAWYDGAARALARFGRKVMFRPHPRLAATGHRLRPHGDAVLGGSLAEALHGAAAAATLNSNAAVEAAFAGVPAWTLDPGAMAWPVAGHDLAEFPPRPDRDAWAARLAWQQYALDELASGFAWDAVAARIAALDAPVPQAAAL